MIREVIHLLPEAPRRQRQDVVVVGDAVVEEDPQPARVRAAPRSREPGGRAGAGDRCLHRIRQRGADAGKALTPRADRLFRR